MKKKHAIRIIIFTLIAAAAVIFAHKSMKNTGAAAQTGANKAPISVETAHLETIPMKEIKEFNGTVKPAYSYIVSAKAAGRLMDISKRIGDKVSANEVIGHIDDTEYRTAVNEANAQLSLAKMEFERGEELFAKGIVSKAEFDALKTQYESQKAKSELAQTALDNTNIRTAKEGFVAMRHIDGGALLSVGSAVLTVVGIDTVFVELAVSEKDYRNITRGKSASVRVDAVGDETFLGSVYRVAPFFNTDSRTALVEIALRNKNGLLKPGMSARINLTLEEDNFANAIPFGAIIENNGVKKVFVIDDSLTAHSLVVETGILDGENIQILSPAEIREPVVTLGHHLLTENARVIISNPKEENKDE